MKAFGLTATLYLIVMLSKGTVGLAEPEEMYNPNDVAGYTQPVSLQGGTNP